jgi:2-hydroxychromene-2-carboxylate isomerase
MSAARRRIRFYFDYISTNAYLAWLWLPPKVRQYDVDLELVPVLFAGLLNAHGQLGPAEVPAKSWWMWKNNVRKAALLGVPLRRPAFHPFNPLLSLRASSLPLPEPDRTRLVGALFDAVWVRGLHVSEPAVVESVARDAGLDGAAIVAAAQQPDAKERLRTQTDAAIAAGVFGVPTMAVGEELFWGYDDVGHLELNLAGRDPLDALDRAVWAEGIAQASASRRRRS